MSDTKDTRIALAEVAEEMVRRAKEFQSIAGSADLDRTEKAVSSVQFLCFVASSIIDEAEKQGRGESMIGGTEK